MIIIDKKDNKITISGHSGYAEHGKDIVCAAISTIAITSINAIESVCNGVINASDDGTNLVIEIIKEDEIGNKLIDNMLNMFDEVIAKYPKNVERK